MRTRSQTELVHEGNLVAEIKVELLDTEEGWSPYLSLADAYKPDDVRAALREGDTVTAAKYGPMYRLTRIHRTLSPPAF